MGAETVVEGVIERITFESADTGFRVIKVAVEGRTEPVSIVGTFPRASVGARVRVRGQVEHDRRHGEQVRAESVVELVPETLAGLEKYLASGLIKGVGPKIAGRIVAAFGLDALRVLDEQPDRLTEVVGLGEKRRLALIHAWNEQRAIRDVMVFLQSHGASPALAMRIVRRYGARAMTVVSTTPYRLALDVSGVGFRTADKIAATLGIRSDSPERIAAGVMQVVHDTGLSGHVWTSVQETTDQTARLLGFDQDDAAARDRIASAGRMLALSGHLVLEARGGESIVYAYAAYVAEVRLARRLRELAHAPVEGLRAGRDAIAAFETKAGVQLAPEQRLAVEEAARRQVLVITGGPGVGKTTIVRAILAVYARAGVAVRLAAPTGRAAKRMTEATGADAVTLHRLLEFEPKSATFKRDKSRPIEAGALVVDEASMLDLPTADALVQALAPGTRLVLVGDVDQLPSVGPGAVLRDSIASGAVHCVRLKQIFRQAARSLIVTNAHRINEGILPVQAPAGVEADFFVVERRDPSRARETIVELVASRIPHRFGLDPVRDIQVLTPMNRGPLGTLALNEALQRALNPSGPGLVRGERVYRVGDKVMQLRNDYEKNVYNGDVGLVTRIDEDEGTMSAGFDDREVELAGADLDDVTLAYACTVHKSQGSEYPAVVIPLFTSHFMMLSRNLLYTAVTRGRRLVVLICDPRALEIALSERRREDRRTLLASRLRELDREALTPPGRVDSL